MKKVMFLPTHPYADVMIITKIANIRKNVKTVVVCCTKN